MKSYRHPPLRTVSLATAMQALADPWRLKIVRQLLDAEGQEFTCSDFPIDVNKATRSHHFQVLREAGIVRMRSVGNTCRTSLRRTDLEKRFPGLLSLLAAEKPPAPTR